MNNCIQSLKFKNSKNKSLCLQKAGIGFEAVGRKLAKLTLAGSLAELTRLAN